MSRVFVNSPMLPDLAAVERYAHDLGALAIRGYTAIDGSHRALLEITPDAAGDEIADEAKRIERRAKLLRARAEEWCQTQPARAGEALKTQATRERNAMSHESYCQDPNCPQPSSWTRSRTTTPPRPHVSACSARPNEAAK